MVIFHRFLLVYQRIIHSARLEWLGNFGYCSELVGPLFWQTRHETFDQRKNVDYWGRPAAKFYLIWIGLSPDFFDERWMDYMDINHL